MPLQKLIPLAAVATLAFGLAACDEHEQGRILQYEKGTYMGKADTGLTDEQRDALRARAALQGGG